MKYRSSLTNEEIMRLRSSKLAAGAGEFWRLAHEVTDIFDVKMSEITGPVRGRMEAIEARQAICHLAYSRGFTMEQIGKFINRDHTTVMHSIQRAEIKAASAPVIFKSKRVSTGLSTNH